VPAATAIYGASGGEGCTQLDWGVMIFAHVVPLGARWPTSAHHHCVAAPSRGLTLSGFITLGQQRSPGRSRFRAARSAGGEVPTGDTPDPDGPGYAGIATDAYPIQEIVRSLTSPDDLLST